MSGTARIRWHETPAGTLAGYAGTLEARLFGIWQPPQADDGEWVLTAELPGMAAVRRYGAGPEELKAEAEQLLGKFTASLGAAFPDAGRQLAGASPLTCDGCSHAPATVLAVMGRTNTDRTPAPGHVLRLLCGECVARTREICAAGGRVVTFTALGPVLEATP